MSMRMLEGTTVLFRSFANMKIFIESRLLSVKAYAYRILSFEKIVFGVVCFADYVLIINLF